MTATQSELTGFEPIDPAAREQYLRDGYYVIKGALPEGATATDLVLTITETLRKLTASQFVANNPGQVCPAKWKEGAKTLAPSLDLVGKI